MWLGGTCPWYPGRCKARRCRCPGSLRLPPPPGYFRLASGSSQGTAGQDEKIKGGGAEMLLSRMFCFFSTATGAKTDPTSPRQSGAMFKGSDNVLAASLEQGSAKMGRWKDHKNRLQIASRLVGGALYWGVSDLQKTANTSWKIASKRSPKRSFTPTPSFCDIHTLMVSIKGWEAFQISLAPAGAREWIACCRPGDG